MPFHLFLSPFKLSAEPLIFFPAFDIIYLRLLRFLQPAGKVQHYHFISSFFYSTFCLLLRFTVF